MEIQRVTTSGSTRTITFGTNDIRDTAPAGPVECVRVFLEVGREQRCGHVHRSRTAALKCARSIALGNYVDSGASYVETRAVGRVAAAQVPAGGGGSSVDLTGSTAPESVEN